MSSDKHATGPRREVELPLGPTLAGMAGDIGSYFEKLTRRAPGGRRLDDGTDHDGGSEPSTPGPATREGRATNPGAAKPSSPSGSGRTGGGIGEILKDVLVRGRSAATKTAAKAKSAAQAKTATRRKPGKPAGPPPGRARQLPREGVVTVEYSPRIDGDPDPGEVVWAWVPFEEDPEQGKDRPVIVIGRRGEKLVGIPLTTKSSDREAQIAVGTGDWDPKRRQSYARIWRMLDLDEQSARREGSALPRQRFDEVITAVDEYYEVRRPAASTSSSRRADGDAGFEFDY